MILFIMAPWNSDPNMFSLQLMNISLFQKILLNKFSPILVSINEDFTQFSSIISIFSCIDYIYIDYIYIVLYHIQYPFFACISFINSDLGCAAANIPTP